ncbi:MAG TPA: thymidylate kinase [Nitrososphaerales archaeon]|nr:thymidylate kinase [Nitrososphaerales archaeon]
MTGDPRRGGSADSSRGALIVVEGVDGSGKSTQLRLLDKWLRAKGMSVYATEWNSSDVVREITSRGKKKALLTPTTFSLLHATDFADRYERDMAPLLRAGYVVLADRYVYTAFARDVVRGCSARWVRKVYDFAAKPDITFYFQAPIDLAMSRIMVGRPKIKYYEAGMDLNLSNDALDSYRIYQSRIVEEYERMIRRDGFSVVDASKDIEEQQMLVRRKVVDALPGLGLGDGGAGLGAEGPEARR